MPSIPDVAAWVFAGQEPVLPSITLPSNPVECLEVSQDRWLEAQRYERRTWMDDCRGANDDRNVDHMANFRGYAPLHGQAFRRVVELGCGPFTNLRLMLPFLTGVQQVTLVDPLIADYTKHAGCSYADGKLAGHPVRLVASTAEQYNGKPADLVVMVNVIQHCRDAAAVLRNVSRLTRGVLVLGELVGSSTDEGHPLSLSAAYLDGFLQQFAPLYDRDVGGFRCFIGRR